MSETQVNVEDRKAWLSLMAKAPHKRMTDLAVPFETPHEELRPPEIGAVMVRGRVGATGAPFNLGEMTVTRCSLRLETGEVGHGYVQGRSKAAAKAVALVDALLQTAAAPELRQKILSPLEQEAEKHRTTRAAKAAATKVEFFTMARGED